ncbi:MAG: molecular chaperone DnaK, partial [Planctomycetes bacterium]|nr:molecular chaperone DnaK [Planctomycetota bacterium]
PQWRGPGRGNDEPTSSDSGSAPAPNPPLQREDGGGSLLGNDSDPIPSATALCLLPAGVEPGDDVELTDHQFELLVAQPIEFPIFVSSTRLVDKPGDLVEVDLEQMKSLPPIRTVLKMGRSKEATSVSVVLHAGLSEIGTLDLSCHEVQGNRSWKLLFDVRSATHTDIEAHQAMGEQQGVFDESLSIAAQNVIARTFQAPNDVVEVNAHKRSTSAGNRELENIVKSLVEVIGLERHEWPTSLLRQLWKELLEVEEGRKLSPQHESRWLNLVGFTLRPGYGLAVDDWRVSETWKKIGNKLHYPNSSSKTELAILWRRIAGGLTSGQQQSLSSSLASTIRQALRAAEGQAKTNDFGRNSHESSESLRLLGACELLPVSLKRDLGEMFVDLLYWKSFTPLRSAALWSIARIGARNLVYGPLNLVIPPDCVTEWVNRLLRYDDSEPFVAFAVMQLARKTGDRYRDLDEKTRTDVLDWMQETGASKHFQDLVKDVGKLEREDQSLIFGEALPKGLRIM